MVARSLTSLLMVLVLTGLWSPASADDPPVAEDNAQPIDDPNSAEIAEVAEPENEDGESAEERPFHTRVYGYIEAYWEKVADTPDSVDAAGNTVNVNNKHEFDVRNINVMMQTRLLERFRAFLNLAAPGASSISVRNAWVEVALLGDFLALRFGKLYRPFGLYNEILDATPTYLGIEPPELFDDDHLMLTRTTNLMLRGTWVHESHALSYAITTGNDERRGDTVPLGFDARYTYLSPGGRLSVLFGSSAYATLGNAAPSKGVGEGSPDGGVATWMEKDKFVVFGAFAQIDLSGFQLQAAYWQAEHDATRDPAQVIQLLDADLNPRQRRRFFGGVGTPTEADVITAVEYSVVTFYSRLGYTFNSSIGSFSPYFQYDFYENPEAIKSKTFGGDNEAGLSDDGRFHKVTIGVVYRPISAIALKVDGSTHIQDFNGETVSYPEIRTALSYYWQL